MSIESNVCDAVELLVDNAIAKAQYDKTIQGTVIKCIDATIGKYLIKYQDSTFNAYASGSGVSYPDGTGVYILVPGNDMSRDKTIIGASEKTAINYIEPEAGEDAYTIVGTQFVEKAEEMNTDVEFISTETEEGMQLFRAFGGIGAILRYYVER